MTDGLIATDGVSGTDAAATKVFRTELNPVDFLRRAAFVYPDKAAVVDGNCRYSYRQLAERSWRLANALRSAGLSKGDRVATLLLNSAPMLEAHFGVPAAGGILVAINNRLASPEVGYILGHSGARFLLVDAELESVVAPLTLSGVTVIRLGTAGGAEDQYEAFLAAASSDEPESWLKDEEETISINYTSGTTGRPKGVQYTYRGAYLNALSEVIVAGLTPESVYLWTLPMFHCNGWCFPWTVAAAAGVNVCLRKVEPTRIFELIKKHGVTHMCGAPIVYNTLINAPDAPKKSAARPVVGLIAGAAPPVAVLEGAENIGIKLTHVYGLTEVYGPASVCAEQPGWDDLPADQRAQLKRRQGVSYPLEEAVTVIDPETMREVPRDGETIGEVMFRGNIVMKGYLRNEKATNEAFAGGWFHTGDLGVLDEHGYVIIKDRSKDIIISGGENISSVEVEDVLYKHPAILFAAVVAKPDGKWGEVPCAFVELKPNAKATEADIIAFCREQLPGFKTPKAVVFGPIPKTSTGKIQKFMLRNQVRSAKAISA